MKYDPDTLILSHLNLAETIANKEWRTATYALEKQEMLSLAFLGLVDAAQRWIPYCEKNEYSPEAVQYFKAFASFRIRGTIRDHLRKEDWATRTLRSKSKKLKQAGQDDGLSVQELSERTGMSISEINKVLARLSARPVSLDARRGLRDYSPQTDSNDIQLKEDIDTEGIAFSNQMNEVFVRKFTQLPEDVQVVLALHYYSRLDLRTISEQLALTESKVSALHQYGALAIREAMTRAATEVM